AWYYGETEELLPKYAWYIKNSQEKTWPVGSMKPNDLGFFDAHGNANTWCQERSKAYPKGNQAIDDVEDDLVVKITDNRALRGGSFFNQASIVRSANRNGVPPTDDSAHRGFRLARTLRLGSFTALPPNAEGGRK